MARSDGHADVFITASVRTPFGRFGGRLRERSPIELGSLILRAAVSRAGSDGEDIGELYVGMGCFEAGQFVPARQMLIGSGLPVGTPSLTVDRACCSGMTSIGLAWRDLLAGSYPRAAVVGVDVLSATPYLLEQTRWGTRRGDFTVKDPLAFRAPFLGDTQIARYTGEVAIERGCGRQAQDAWAVASHQRYGEALGKGLLDRQVLSWAAVESGDVLAADATAEGSRQDEQYRADAELERLASLPTVYGSPTVTAGNAPGLNDGAAAVVLSTRDAIGEAGPPRAQIIDYLQMAGEPTSAVYLPGRAVTQIVRRNGLSMSQVHVVEINEAYAATALCSVAEMASEAAVPAEHLAVITNAWGGAIASGHPLGASGVRIVANVIDRLAARGGGVGVAAICGGFGQTDALLVRLAEP
jgi:acetyl-CoA C-acetyltransferase